MLICTKRGGVIDHPYARGGSIRSELLLICMKRGRFIAHPYKRGGAILREQLLICMKMGGVTVHPYTMGGVIVSELKKERSCYPPIGTGRSYLFRVTAYLNEKGRSYCLFV